MIEHIEFNSGNNYPQEVVRYLNKYGIPGWNIEIADNSNITTAIIIPAIMEYDNLKKLLISLSENDNSYFSSTVIIFVINNGNASELVRSDNIKSLGLIRQIINKTGVDELTVKVINSGLRAALVDASSPGKELPEKDAGVGLARKIGMDLSLTIFDYNIPGKKLLLCLDADCTVDNNYLTEITRFYSNNASAAVIKYAHSYTQDEYAPAIVCYEIFMRYYLLGLQYAGSHYAYHTIGSTISCDHLSYIKAEGMNKKKAAEDFYFLEKIAKNTRVERITGTTVYPSPRKSWRVPFGTGQRIARFLAGIQNEYLTYAPESFIILKEWLALFHDQAERDADWYLIEAENIHTGLRMFLEEQKFSQVWQRIRNNKDAAQIRKQKLFWFDAFKTMKLIHYLRDNYLPQRNMFDALDELLQLCNIEIIQRHQDIPDLETQEQYLFLLREVTA